jgi:predicted RNA-binding Zn ribbon-like protein
VPASDRFRQGSGRPCLDFIRTLRHRGSPRAVEELPDAEALTAWMVQCSPVVPDAPGAGAVAAAQALREAVAALIVAGRVAGLGGCDPAAREQVNRAAAAPVPAPVLDDSGALGWRAADPVSATLALIARDALDLVTSPALGRLRECADPDCHALFVDNSRPGSRRWCSMDICGNRAKKANLRRPHSGT